MKKLLLTLILLSGTILVQTDLNGCYKYGTYCNFNIECCSNNCHLLPMGGQKICY